VKHFAKLLQEGGPHAELGKQLSVYQRTLDSMGLSDALVNTDNNKGHVFRCAFLALQFALLGLLALPGALLFIPFWCVASWTFRTTVRKGLSTFGSLDGKSADNARKYLEKKGISELVPETIIRHRANFDTINDNYMKIGFVWLCLLLCGTCTAVAHCSGKVWYGVAMGWAALPAAIFLMIRCLDSCCAILREIQSLRALASMTDESLLHLCAERSQLQEFIKQLPRPEPDSIGDESDVLQRMPRWDFCGFIGRHKKDWQEHFGLRVDSSHMAQNEDIEMSVLPLTTGQLNAQLLAK